MVSLFLEDGSVVKLVFSGAHNPKSEVYGGIDNGQSGSYVPLLADEDLLQGLRAWAVEIATPTGISDRCSTIQSME